jgi:hypothetical protein
VAVHLPLDGATAMSDMSDVPREWIAYEEASHAVVGIRLGLKIKLATIKPSRDSWGRVELRNILRKGGDLRHNSSPVVKARAECAVLVHLAGQYGPKRIAPESWRENRNTPDYDLVKELIFHRLHPSLHDGDMVAWKYLSYLEARAELLVWQYGKEIDVVAKALTERETLTGDEIIALIDEEAPGLTEIVGA